MTSPRDHKGDRKGSRRYQTGGTVRPNRPYVERAADDELFEALLRGEFCYVFNCRQIGKSSLLARVRRRLEAEAVFCGAIDLTSLGADHVTPEQWYRGLVGELNDAFGKLLGQKPELDTWWEALENLPLAQRLGQFLDELLVRVPDRPIVIFIDEIDTVLSLERDYGVRTGDFFALLRAFDNRRAETSGQDYERLTFALFGAATPSRLMRDRSRTPFNIGRAIDLGPLALEQSDCLLAGLEGSVAEPRRVLAAVFGWSGGQPFLTQWLCEQVRLLGRRAAGQAGEGSLFWQVGQEEAAVAALVREQVLEVWRGNGELMGGHLMTIQQRVLEQEALVSRLLGLYGEVLERGVLPLDGDEAMLLLELRLAGLVVRRGEGLEIFNRIYREVFDEAWLREQLDRLRPYRVKFNAWLGSGKRDEACLLVGEEWKAAEAWQRERVLGDDDRAFLMASQKLNQQEVLAAEWEAKGILEKASTKARRWMLVSFVGAGVAVAIAVVSGVIAFKSGLRASEAVEQVALEKKNQDDLSQKRIQLTRDNENLDKKLKETQKQLRNEKEQVKNTQESEQRANQSLAEISQQEKKAQQDLAEARQRARLAQQQAKELEQKFTMVSQQAKEAEKKTRQTRIEIEQAKLKLTETKRQVKISQEEADIAEKTLSWAEWRLKVAEIQVKASKSQSKIQSGKQMIGLMESIRAGRSFQNLNKQNRLDIKNKNTDFLDAEVQVKTALLEVYEIQEYNFWRDHFSGIENVKYSSDGNTIVAGDSNGVLSIRRSNGVSILIDTEQGSIVDLSVSTDGNTIASAGKYGGIKVWGKEGNLISSFEVDSFSGIRSVVYSPDGKTIIVGTQGSGDIYIFNTDGSIRNILRDHHQGNVESISFSADGKNFVSADVNGVIKVWNLNGQNILTIASSLEWIHSAIFSYDQKTMLAADREGSFALWDISSGRKRVEFNSGGKLTFDSIFSIDGEKIISGGEDGIYVWDIHGELLQFLPSHQGEILSVDLHPNGKSLLSGGINGEIKSLSINREKYLKFDSKHEQISAISYSADSSLIASSGFKDGVKLWDRDGNEISIIRSIDSIYSVAFHPRENKIVYGGSSGSLYLMDLDKQRTKFIPGYILPVRGLSPLFFSDDSSHLQNFGLLSSNELGHFEGIYDVEYSLDGSMIASTGHDGSVKLWNSHGQKISEFEVPRRQSYLSLSFSPLGQKVATGGIDGTLTLWDIHTSEPIEINTSQGSISGIDHNHSGEKIATSGDKGILKIWNSLGEQLRVIVSTQGRISSVQYAPEGDILASGYEDGTVKLWNSKGEEVIAFGGHESAVSSISFSPNGKMIASGDSNGFIRIMAWDVDSLLELACDWANDYLRTNPDVTDEDRALCGIPPRAKDNRN